MCDKHWKRVKRKTDSRYREKTRIVAARYRAKHLEKVKARAKILIPAWYRKLKAACYEVYGGAKCACCGETEILFLTLDHVNNDGHKFRKDKKNIGGYRIYRWIAKQGFPLGMFQVMCFNCNSGRARNGGICPHKKGELDVY